MKPTAIVTCLVLIATVSVAQDKIKASDIIRQINEGKAVEYFNVEIEGDLDLTDLRNREIERQSGNIFGIDTDMFASTVEVPLKFTNCTFRGDVLAYYHLDRANETYVAHFEQDVTFTNCSFKNKSEFKYSEFSGKVRFVGCTFDEQANFKYAEFSSGPSFKSSRFESGADFKYTQFPRGTSFENATFYGLVNFKYSKFRSPVNLDGIAFRGTEDFKYTKIDREDFASYLLQNR